MNRRTFLKTAGLGSVSVAASCRSESDKILYTLVQAPEDMVTGKATWYTSTCRECPAGCGVLAKNREGRVVKVEGNPLHPINRGNLCIRGQAALQGIYNPDRLRKPLLKENNRWQPISFRQAEAMLRAKAMEAAERGSNRVRMISEVIGDSMLSLFKDALKRWRSEEPLLYEPYAYESLKTAHNEIFGNEGLPSYHMEQSDFLISFGADFLETWLSPVEYARKFKTMHAVDKEQKGCFFYISPYQSLTGANADRWIPCHPGGETAIALGCIREALGKGKGSRLPNEFRSAIESIALPYDKAKVLTDTDISTEHYDSLLTWLFMSNKPLVLGTGTGSTGPNTLQTNMAVSLLNCVLDPDLSLFDFKKRHRVEIANRRSDVMAYFEALQSEPVDLLLLNNVNPLFTLPPATNIKESLTNDTLFVACFSNFMDETAAVADLIFPVRLPLETWDEYSGRYDLLSTLQPTMGMLTKSPNLGDVFLDIAYKADRPAENYKTYIYSKINQAGNIGGKADWVKTLQKGGRYQDGANPIQSSKPVLKTTFTKAFQVLSESKGPETKLLAVPSIRFFDGRGANRPWLCEIPDPITKVAWHTPVLMHPNTLKQKGIAQEDVIRLESQYGVLEAPVYEYEGLKPGFVVMSIGQGHDSYGRYAKKMGQNPIKILSPDIDPNSGSPWFFINDIRVTSTGRSELLASISGSRIQHGRKIALSVPLKKIKQGKAPEKAGLGMVDFPLTLPLPEGYNKKRDIYPPHDHDTYRWAMVADLDRCIGCGACAAACYAENNLGIVEIDRVREGREMAWLSVERYHDSKQMEKIMFLPMLCQHCDNAPCESVCPVYAPHHSKEGINNQIYNRCIGTRFCSQNCPYKVRRFNWFSWKWPDPLPLQLNPDVTVRRAGVMEKCSFCIQRIKGVRTVANNEKRKIRDGEVIPACVQTCPTQALVFGNLMDKTSRVRKLVEDERAYQVMGYLNTKPAVIYLKKVLQEV
jgi:molybdopterin-containing oxidoreductase family iron-sulfur binding subunit